MMKIDTREHSLYGIMYPHDMRLIKKELDALSDAINEIYSSNNPQQLVWIDFDFNQIDKGDVYKLLVTASRLQYGLRYSERKLAKILALFTNLADSPSRETRINTIRCNYKYYKKKFK